MSETLNTKKFLGQEGTKALIDSIKSGYSPIDHEHDVVTNATNAEHSSTADTAAEATHAVSADTATNAEHAATADSATKAEQDSNGNVIVDTYETKEDAISKLDEAKEYTDTVASTVKDELLNGAGEAYDTLKELGDLINENTTALDVLEEVAIGKADADHVHSWDELEDKPFGEVENVIVEIVDTTVHCEYIKGPDICIADPVYLCSPSLFEIGKEYTIEYKVNDQSYNSGLICNDQTSLNVIDDVNISINTMDDTLAMVLECYSLGINETTDVVVSVRISESVVKQIDEKYIPNTISREGHTHDWSEFGELPENVLVYDSQALTEEQKMQARKNLGLYNKSYEPTVVIRSNGYEVSEGSIPENSGMSCEIILHAVASDFYLTYTTTVQRYYNYGTDITHYFIGNSEMFAEKTDSDPNPSRTDMPFVFYTDETGMTRIYLDESKMENTDKYGVYDITVVNPDYKNEVITTIPEEYIPDTIARIEDVPEVQTDVLVYTEQELTEEQQMQTRKNLGLYYKNSTIIYKNDNITFSQENNLSVDVDYLNVEIDKMYHLTSTNSYINDSYGVCFGNSRYEVYGIEFKNSSGNTVFYYENGILKWDGMYFPWDSLTCSVTISEVEIEQISEEFIPETIARIEDVYNIVDAIEFPEQVNADYMESDETSKAFIKNRPGYKGINLDLYSKIETLNVGNYCLIDFNVVTGNYTNYLTYEDLSKDYNRSYDYYINYTLSGNMPITKRIGKFIKDLDGTNCYCNVYTHPDAYTELYIIHDRELLSSDLKAKILNNGVWLIITGDETQVPTKISNFEFIEYFYAKFDENLLPTTVVFQRDLVGYVSEDKLNESITGLENELTSYTDTKIADLVNSAPETLDTLGELATAFTDNKEVVDALDAAITNKVDTSVYEEHVTNSENRFTTVEGNVTNLQAAIDEFEEFTSEEIIAMFAAE